MEGVRNIRILDIKSGEAPHGLQQPLLRVEATKPITSVRPHGIHKYCLGNKRKNQNSKFYVKITWDYCK